VVSKRWQVRTEAGDEHVEADEVEITSAGVLEFYRRQSRQENQRSLLLALSPGAWQRCRLESEG